MVNARPRTPIHKTLSVAETEVNPHKHLPEKSSAAHGRPAAGGFCVWVRERERAEVGLGV